jgi:hypothetical protein
MSDAFLTNFLSFAYPYLAILFWVLVLIAIVWGAIKLLKKFTGKKSNK